MKSKLTGIFL